MNNLNSLARNQREYTREEKIRELTSPVIAKKVEARIELENRKLNQIDDYSLESLLEDVA